MRDMYQYCVLLVSISAPAELATTGLDIDCDLCSSPSLVSRTGIRAIGAVSFLVRRISRSEIQYQQRASSDDYQDEEKAARFKIDTLKDRMVDIRVEYISL